MAWTEIKFGKYRGKGMSLPQIVFDDPDWFFYMVERDAFFGRLGDEAADIAYKAGHIRIPYKNPDQWEVEYVSEPGGRFERMVLVRADEPAALSDGARGKFIDLGYTRHLRPYDKKGSKRLARWAKLYLFGEGVRLTKARCEAFFDDPKNFR